MTPNSSLTAYLTGTDFLARKDLRSVCQYASDDPQNPVPDNQAATNPNVLAALNSASGMLEAATLMSQRYQVSDLQALNGMSLEWMKSVLSDIAMYLLMTRRPGPSPPETVVTAYEKANETLQALASGERILAFTETAEAGLPETYKMTVGDLYRNNAASLRFRRVFGNRLETRRFY